MDRFLYYGLVLASLSFSSIQADQKDSKSAESQKHVEAKSNRANWTEKMSSQARYLSLKKGFDGSLTNADGMTRLKARLVNDTLGLVCVVFDPDMKGGEENPRNFMPQMTMFHFKDGVFALSLFARGVTLANPEKMASFTEENKHRFGRRDFTNISTENGSLVYRNSDKKEPGYGTVVEFREDSGSPEFPFIKITKYYGVPPDHEYFGRVMYTWYCQ